MGFSIAIIGMGACGVAAFAEATIRLAAAPIGNVELHLVSREDDLGPGLAFGTDQPGHLLNTESRLMGLYASEPGHFREWVAKRRPLDPGKVEYAPRAEYGEYIRQVLADAYERADRAGIPIHVHRSEAIAIEGNRDAAAIRLRDGTIIDSDYTLLAIGTPRPARFGELEGCLGYFDFPWPARRLREGIGVDQDVIVLGSSLSAIDSFATLMDQGHRGLIHFVSKDGMLPRVEIPAPEETYPRVHFTLSRMRRLIRERGPRFSIVDLFRLFRREAEEAAAAQGERIDWHAENRMDRPALDALPIDIARADARTEIFQRILTSARFEASAMWDLLGPRDRDRFVRWLGPHFATARFTMPMTNACRLAEAAARGQLRVHGGVKDTIWDAERRIFISSLANGDTVCAPVVVNATGTAMTLDEIPDALIVQLADRGWLHPHPSGGVEAHRQTGEVITHDRDAPRLYAVGQLVNGVQRDTNAVWFNVQCAEKAVQDMLIKIAGDAR
ncbi:FAD/NAD(P)-binding protein [Sphingomonas sp.]|uniref:FAD/NAD(P)-binding protein n=1 Tax=Sphingomonas sp. TaxID=28214 RepID=UPI0028967C34|nr:FAD/NAD(P)-binding protein [Sphingomonas sp.]